MKHRPKQPKWAKALKRKLRTPSYLNQQANEAFAKSLGISVEELNKEMILSHNKIPFI